MRNFVLLLLAPVVNAVESAAVVDSAAAGSTKDAVATTSNGLGLASDALVDGHFAAPKDAVTHNKACFEHKTLAVGELVKPFVSEDPDASLFLNPYVKTSRDGGSMTWKYEREPSTVEEALALLQKDDLSFVLRFERLDLAQWPEELKALIPEELKSELIADLAEGGTTVHLYLSAPETSALPHHADIGDVLVLQLAGEKQWFFDEGEPVTMSPGDALWVPVGTKHSAKSTGDVSAHLTIHRVTEDHKRRLNHITGDDGANDDPVSEWSDTACFPFGDAGCYGCGCNLCNICATDSGAFCTTKAEDVAVVDPCCGNGDYDECVAGEGAPQDVAYFALLSDPSKGCDYVAKSPGDRCDERGVFLGTFSNNNRPFGSDRVIDHYGEDWLLENQPRYKAKDACPVACAGGGGGGGGAKCGDCEDDGDWEYVPGDKGGKQNCKDVADIPEKRCERVGTDGRKAKKACPCACKDYGGKCSGGGGSSSEEAPSCDGSSKDAKNWRYKGKNCKKAAKEGKCNKKGKDKKTGEKSKGTDSCCKSCSGSSSSESCEDDDNFVFLDRVSCGKSCTQQKERSCKWFKKNRDRCNEKGWLYEDKGNRKDGKRTKAKDACPKSCKEC
mmetsp:Transcript_21536/g.64443  ORF Transcript_21536/g.64443 Transcript_21536/m.64443 type:complete len:614 (+) Transcript_21536:164-2005(+)